jgi:hypothetical protein
MVDNEKKWLLDFSTQECSLDPATVAAVSEQFTSAFHDVPAAFKQHKLFIHSSTWMPMTVEDAFTSIKSQEDKEAVTWTLISNWPSFVTAVRLLHLSSSTSTDANENSALSITSKTWLSIISFAEVLLKIEFGSSQRSYLKAKLVESLESLCLASQHLTTPSSTFIGLQSISYLSKLFKLAQDLDFTEAKELYDAVQRSGLPNAIHSSLDPTTSASVLEYELEVLIATTRERPMPLESIEKYLADAEAIVNFDERKFQILLPLLSKLLQFAPEHTSIGGELSVAIVASLSRDSDTSEPLKTVAKFVSGTQLLSTAARLLLSSSTLHSAAAKLSSLYWLRRSPTFEDLQLFLNAISTHLWKTSLVPSKRPIVTETIKEALVLIPTETFFKYHLQWLKQYPQLSSLDRVLTHIETIEEIRPIVDLLEIGFDFLRIITPPKHIATIDNATTESPRKILIEEISPTSSRSVDGEIFNDLISLLLERIDIPEYFFHLNETRDYDKENFRFAELRVKAFQHLVGHYWHLLDVLLSYMPPVQELTKNNPALLLPEGVAAPYEVPLWFDELLVMMATHAIDSDFFTREASRDVGAVMATLLETCKHRNLPRNPFVLRLRNLLSFIKTRKSIDEAHRFSMSMWLCSQIPLGSLSRQDSFDAMVASNLVQAINDTLSDHRPEIKILALKLVISICSLSSPTQSQTSKGNEDESSATISGASHLPSTTFESIIRSLNFREPVLVDMALRACILLITAHNGEPQLRLAWSTTLMNAVNYEMDYIQKSDLLFIYMERLREILPLLESKIVAFSHPLLVRHVALLDIGTFQMTKLALENIAAIMTLAWPRNSVEYELVFGALATTWIDQIWVMPGEIVNDKVRQNVDILRRIIKECLVLLVATVDKSKLQNLSSELDGLEALKDFQAFLTQQIDCK